MKSNNKILLNYACSIINISINTHENNLCPHGEIARQKGIKRRGINTLMSP